MDQDNILDTSLDNTVESELDQQENKAFSTMASESFFNTRKVAFGDVTKNQAINDYVDSESFLQACKEFAEVYDRIGGTTFAPLKSDVMGNVNKLVGKCKEYNLTTIEQLVEFEVTKNTTTAKGSATDALVWLKRGLWLFCQFLTNVVNGEENAQRAFSSSYDTTLAKHHNFFVRKLFSAGLLAFPSWETLMPLFLTKYDPSEGDKKTVLMAHIKNYLDAMRPLLEQLDMFYMSKKLAN